MPSSRRRIDSTSSATRPWFLEVSLRITDHCSAVDSSIRVKVLAISVPPDSDLGVGLIEQLLQLLVDPLAEGVHHPAGRAPLGHRPLGENRLAHDEVDVDRA